MIATTESSKKMESIANMWAAPTPVLYAYGIFCAVSFFVYHLVAEREPSSTLTLSAIAQCLGVSMLWIQVQSGRGAWGISAKSLRLDALAICLRLCSTLFLDGYLPNSTDGDFVYQFFDVCAVIMLLFLLRSVHLHHADTYQATDDTLPVVPMVFACFVLAALLHGDMDDNAIFDALWMAGLLTSVVAVLPQFWLITKSGCQAGAMTSHYIFSMAFSRFLAGCFAFMAWEHLSSAPYIDDFQHARWVILGAHVVHVLILCDFLFVYLHSMAKNGIYGTMNFGEGLIRQGASYV
jgi:hypothetical protein